MSAVDASRANDSFGPSSSDDRKSPHTSSISGAPSAGGASSMHSSKSPSAIEEGDFVWVCDESGVCTSAVVVRVGFVFDNELEQEQQVTVVHTEDGEERALRDRPVVRLPACHHPKQLLAVELHDLSTVPLMATNVRAFVCLLWRVYLAICADNGRLVAPVASAVFCTLCRTGRYRTDRDIHVGTARECRAVYVASKVSHGAGVYVGGPSPGWSEPRSPVADLHTGSHAGVQ